MKTIRPYRHVIRAFATGVITLLPAGCLVLDEEHCLANGGDFACPGTRCQLEAGQVVESITDDLGCSTQDVTYQYHLRLKYGLPVNVMTGNGEPRNMDSLEGVLRAVREDNGGDEACLFNDSELQPALDKVVTRHSKIIALRERLEDSGQVKAKKLTQDEIDDVHAYNDAVDVWLAACLEKVISEAP